MDKVIFRESDHTYWLGDKQLISVTQLLKKHGLAPDYSAVGSETLNTKAERGTLIHKEVEDYIKTEQSGFTEELQDFNRLCTRNSLLPEDSEIVVNNELVAGTVDLILNCQLKGYAIADIKTSTTINKEYCRWQLSLYEYLLRQCFEKMYIFHLCEKSKLIEIERIPQAELDRLLECEKNGEIYQPKALIVPETDLAELHEAEQIISAIETHLKELKEKQQAIRESVMTAMQSQGVKSFENEQMKITYIEPTTRETIDSAKLKKELPDVAAKYLKKSNVKASVRITLRKEDE